MATEGTLAGDVASTLNRLITETTATGRLTGAAAHQQALDVLSDLCGVLIRLATEIELLANQLDALDQRVASDGHR